MCIPKNFPLDPDVPFLGTTILGSKVRGHSSHIMWIFLYGYCKY